MDSQRFSACPSTSRSREPKGFKNALHMFVFWDKILFVARECSPAGQSASFTSRRSRVRAPSFPPVRTPLIREFFFFPESAGFVVRTDCPYGSRISALFYIDSCLKERAKVEKHSLFQYNKLKTETSEMRSCARNP